MKHRKHRRHRHPDSSDDDNEEDGYVDDHGHFHSKPLDPSELPTYNERPPLRPPTPAPEIRPDAQALVQKEMLKLLSGMFSWNQFLRGEKTPKCALDSSVLNAVKVRKLESSWKCSVTRRSALTISDATQNKDLDAVYATMVERRHLMDHARSLAHRARCSKVQLPPLRAASTMEKSRSAPDNQPRSASAIGRHTPDGEDPHVLDQHHQQQTLSSLLLLNDDMLVHEAQRLLHSDGHCLQQCSGKAGRAAASSVVPSNRVVEETLLRHRSLSPLMDTLHPHSHRENNKKSCRKQLS